LTPYNRSACLVSETAGVVATKKMNLLKWNNTNPTPRATHQTNAFRGRGLDVAENIRASGRGRKMFLDIPFYRTGVNTHNPIAGDGDISPNNCSGTIPCKPYTIS